MRFRLAVAIDMEVNLVMFSTSGKRKDFPIVGHSATIGRGEGCDLRVPLLSVSRRHCQISIGDDGVIVKDLSSSNGTYVNSKRIGEQALLPGDRLVVGPVVFTVQIDGQPEEVQPPKTRIRKVPAVPSPDDSSRAAETIVTASRSGDDTHTPVPSEETDPIEDLENLVAEALQEDEEGQEDSTASKA